MFEFIKRLFKKKLTAEETCPFLIHADINESIVIKEVALKDKPKKPRTVKTTKLKEVKVVEEVKPVKVVKSKTTTKKEPAKSAKTAKKEPVKLTVVKPIEPAKKSRAKKTPNK